MTSNNLRFESAICVLCSTRDTVTLSTWMSNADNMPKFSNLFKKFQKSNFHCHIWIQHEKCIQMSTNKPSIGSVFLKIASWILRNIVKFQFFFSKTEASLESINALHTGYSFRIKKVKVGKYLLKSSRCYIKNHWTNTRLVCTHFKDFFFAESKYGNDSV